MITNYAKERLTAVITEHLTTVEGIPAGFDVATVATDLAQVCLTELTTAGLTAQSIESLFVPSLSKAQAGGTKRN